MDEDAPRGDAIRFTGNWQDFAPIAFTNLLLTIVTLGIYTFWARARVRRYLWSHTRFIDDPLEWTGTGLELFLGYVLAFVLILVPFGVINLVLQGVLLRGHAGIGGLIVLVLYIMILFLAGVALFRALRYRLSRTYWHGIRGGSDDQGIAYGWSYLWRTIAGIFTLGLMIPWSMTNLWNGRWNAMSFGPYEFRSDANWSPVFARFLLFYLAPILLFGFVMVLAVTLAPLMNGFDPANPGRGAMIAFAAGAALFYVIYFGLLGVIAMIFYSAYMREAIGSLAIGDLSFSFTATAWQWIKLFLGNIGLVIVTLGIGYIFVGYRNWAFAARHLHVHGELSFSELTQSQTRAPGQGEGLLDAFDMGAF
ncbi:YjgN family protein [soil metagenome]